jgi:hypothetical protein
MKDVNRDVRAFADRDCLVETIAQLVAVVAQVRRVQAAGCRGRLRQRDQLVELGVGIRRVDEPGRHAIRALFHRVGDERRHFRELVGGRRAIVVPHHELTHLAEPDVRKKVDGDLRARDGVEISGEVGPRRADAGAARVRRIAALRRLAGRHRAALPDHFCRHALPDLAFGVSVDEQREIGMRVGVDEAWGKHLAAGVDRPDGGTGHPADADDPSAAYGDGAGRRGTARAVHDAGVRDQEIEWRCRGRL